MIASRASALFAPRQVGRKTMPSPLLVVLATIGAVLLLVVAVNRWATPSDEHAYWLAAERLLNGEDLYDPNAEPVTPYAYFYPPPLAQALVPVAAVVPAEVFTALWTVLLLACIWWMAGKGPLAALALVAFLPVAVELWFRNIHLVLAVLVVLGIRRWPVLFAIGAAIKIAPGVGILYLAARGRWRDVGIACLAGFVILVVSVALSPGAWQQFISIVGAGNVGAAIGLLPVPYVIRAVIAAVVAVIAGRLDPKFGEPLLVVAVLLALPTFWVTGLSLLVAIVPLVMYRWVERTEDAVAAPAPAA